MTLTGPGLRLRVYSGRVELGRAAAHDVATALLQRLRRQARRLFDQVRPGNGHIAFNDPPLASFTDPAPARVMRLDDRSRQQQVNDGCFPALAEVPTHAITLTIPTLMSAQQLFCVAPGPTKAAAVAAAMHGPIEVSCPASVLRQHPSCVLYLDTDSATELRRRLGGVAVMKVAVIGLGNNGQAKVSHLTESELADEIVVHDVDPDRADAMAERYGARPVSEFEKILADEQIGLVAIATPNDAHAQLTIAALEAGKPVLCEKPMATTLSAATSMVEAAERTGGFLQIGFELRYSKLYTTIKGWIDSGLLGEVVNTHCTFVTSEYLGRRSWRADPAVCGDMFAEKLSHYVDLPRWWLPGEVRDIYAVSAQNIVPYFGVPDNYHAIYQFDSGAVSELSFLMGPASTIAHDPLTGGRSRPPAGDGHELRYIVYGTRGAVQSEVYGRRLVRWELSENEHGMTGEIVEEHTWDPAHDSEYYHNTRDETLDVVRRVAEGRPPAIDPRDALATTRLCFAACESAAVGGTVALSDLA